MSYDDWSSRKLRRKYIRAIKDVWIFQKRCDEVLARVTRNDRDNYQEELSRRGWMV